MKIIPFYSTLLLVLKRKMFYYHLILTFQVDNHFILLLSVLWSFGWIGLKRLLAPCLWQSLTWKINIFYISIDFILYFFIIIFVRDFVVIGKSVSFTFWVYYLHNHVLSVFKSVFQPEQSIPAMCLSVKNMCFHVFKCFPTQAKYSGNAGL